MGLSVYSLRMSDLAASLARGTQHTEGMNFPVAKSNLNGSGSNKFCLAVLAWGRPRLDVTLGWAGEIDAHLEPTRLLMPRVDEVGRKVRGR